MRTEKESYLVEQCDTFIILEGYNYLELCDV